MLSGGVHDHTSQFFPPNLFLYVNLIAQGAQKLFKTLALQLKVLVHYLC
jgi:hypothetical protein